MGWERYGLFSVLHTPCVTWHGFFSHRRASQHTQDVLQGIIRRQTVTNICISRFKEKHRCFKNECETFMSIRFQFFKEKHKHFMSIANADPHVDTNNQGNSSIHLQRLHLSLKRGRAHFDEHLVLFYCDASHDHLLRYSLSRMIVFWHVSNSLLKLLHLSMEHFLRCPC